MKLNPGLGINTIDENAIEEWNEERLAFTSDFEVNEIERKVNEMNFTSDTNLEDYEFKNFTKHLDEGISRKHLVSVSQDIHGSEIRCENFRKGDVNLQIKLKKFF